MRAAGLDVAAPTGHATLLSIGGLSTAEWNRTGRLADAANEPGDVNVWFTGGFTDLAGSSSMGKLYDWVAARRRWPT